MRTLMNRVRRSCGSRARLAGLLKISEEEDEGGGREKEGGSKAEQGKVFLPPTSPLEKPDIERRIQLTTFPRSSAFSPKQRFEKRTPGNKRRFALNQTGFRKLNLISFNIHDNSSFS